MLHAMQPCARHTTWYIHSTDNTARELDHRDRAHLRNFISEILVEREEISRHDLGKMDREEGEQTGG
jgi:hypothetical protein